MSAQPKLRYTLEEYLELDRISDERLEFWDGEIFSMSGVSDQHSQIEVNVIVSLDARLSGRGCRVFPANMRIKVPSLPPYRYGDVSALCGEPQFEVIEGVDVLVNPVLIIVVLSKSTEARDRGEKFTHYKSIRSFSEYLLISQSRSNVSQFIKQGDGFWLHREFDSIVDAIKLASFNCELSLKEIYRNIKFGADK
jgi:Uma2 family endonuclease